MCQLLELELDVIPLSPDACACISTPPYSYDMDAGVLTSSNMRLISSICVSSPRLGCEGIARGMIVASVSPVVESIRLVSSGTSEVTLVGMTSFGIPARTGRLGGIMDAIVEC